MTVAGQQSLFGFPVDVDHTPRRRKKQATSGRMVSIQCQGCGTFFMSFVRGVRCDRCRKEKRAEKPKREWKTGRVSEYGYIDEFPPDY